MIGESRNDLIGIISSFDYPLKPEEVGELFLRITQSILAFPGTALETILALTQRGATCQGSIGRAEIMETLRLFPTSWRLVRVAVKDHRLGEFRVKAGQEVIIATSVIHRSSQAYVAENDFNPDRFRDRNLERSKFFIPFGRGRGMCPGREAGTAAMIEIMGAITSNYVLGPHVRPIGDPYVRALMVMERNEFSYARKTV
ncbi:cytochrome P450 [Citricoccus sp. NR2]|uniref:cytochrome P450 n=1 Tax=Citricoccus sp. NR2 TaxID=3004095 RepID=UPI0022DD831F|nr:cytochrome P450 [Citricoccus sp. NR2]WBL20048.1 cytochrome P450 [Citricoccus sp. NR2]